MLINDGFFFIIGKDDTTAARQTAREFLKGLGFSFSGVFIAQGVTYLNSQFCFRNIKVYFKIVMIKDKLFNEFANNLPFLFNELNKIKQTTNSISSHYSFSTSARWY